MVNVYILIEVGKQKVRQKFFLVYNFIEIGEKVYLYWIIVVKIIDGNEGVSLRSIKRFFKNFDLDLEEYIDYQLF